MDFSQASVSPPPLSRSSLSPQSSNYPSPESLDPQYRLASLYGPAYGANIKTESEGPKALVAMSSGHWSDSSMMPPSTSSHMSTVIPAEYDQFQQYEPPPMRVSYTHEVYPTYSAHASVLSESPQTMARTLSHSPDLAPRQHGYSYVPQHHHQQQQHHHHQQPHPQQHHHHHHDGAHGVRPKVEIVDRPMPLSSPYAPPSSHPSHQVMAEEVGSYDSGTGSSGYISDVTPGSWSKHEYSTTMEPGDMSYHSSGPTSASASASAYMQERQAYRAQRVPRKQPRRLTTKEEANYQCEVKGCGKLFSRSYNYKAHLETHDDKREYPFPCTVDNCEKKFVRKTDLQRHNQSVHMKEKNHKCDYCGRMFARKDTLRRHMEDGCAKRFDIGTLDLPADNYESYEARPMGSHMELPHLRSMNPAGPATTYHNLMDPVASLRRRDA